MHTCPNSKQETFHNTIYMGYLRHPNVVTLHFNAIFGGAWQLRFTHICRYTRVMLFWFYWLLTLSKGCNIKLWRHLWWVLTISYYTGLSIHTCNIDLIFLAISCNIALWRHLWYGVTIAHYPRMPIYKCNAITMLLVIYAILIL